MIKALEARDGQQLAAVMRSHLMEKKIAVLAMLLTQA
jgi:DNA-binding GntR family transcriptional regulator